MSDTPDRMRFVLVADFTHLAFSSAVEPLQRANHRRARRSTTGRWRRRAVPGAAQPRAAGADPVADAGHGRLTVA